MKHGCVTHNKVPELYQTKQKYVRIFFPQNKETEHIFCCDFSKYFILVCLSIINSKYICMRGGYYGIVRKYGIPKFQL